MDRAYESVGEFFETKIDAATVQAYVDTNYCVLGEESFIINVGKFNKKLIRFFENYHEHSCAFITACNPYSRIVCDADNFLFQRELAADLDGYRLTYVAGIGLHPSNKWPGEESFLILGIDIDFAKKIGKKFKQNAIVWCGTDGIPELVLLR